MPDSHFRTNEEIPKNFTFKKFATTQKAFHLQNAEAENQLFISYYLPPNKAHMRRNRGKIQKKGSDVRQQLLHEFLESFKKTGESCILHCIF